MKKRVWCVVAVSLILVALSGCGAGEAEQDVRIQNAQEISVTDLEAMSGEVTEESEDEQTIPQIAECDERTEATPRMLCIDGAIYYDTGRISDALRCGLMDWIIDSSVSEDEIPTQDNQSNFGTGYGYQRWTKGQVHVNFEDGWHIFQASEAYRLTVTNGNNGELVELERSPEFWEVVEKYQNLDVTALGKKADSMGYPYCLRLYDAENNLLATMNHVGRNLDVDGALYYDNGYGTVNELYLVLDALFEEDFPEATASKKVVLQGETSQGDNGEHVTSENIDILEDVYMSVTYATDKGANLVLMNYSDKNMECGDDYELQMCKDGDWYQVDYIIDNWAFNAIAYMMPKNEPVSIYIDWTHFHGILPAGQYRIVKSVLDFRGTGDYTTYRLAAEFEVQ